MNSDYIDNWCSFLYGNVSCSMFHCFSCLQGNDPTAFSVLTQALTGKMAFIDAEFCATCGERGAEKRCSLCKMVRKPPPTSDTQAQGFSQSFPSLLLWLHLMITSMNTPLGMPIKWLINASNYYYRWRTVAWCVSDSTGSPIRRSVKDCRRRMPRGWGSSMVNYTLLSVENTYNIPTAAILQCTIVLQTCFTPLLFILGPDEENDMVKETASFLAELCLKAEERMASSGCPGPSAPDQLHCPSTSSEGPPSCHQEWEGLLVFFSTG